MVGCVGKPAPQGRYTKARHVSNPGTYEPGYLMPACGAEWIPNGASAAERVHFRTRA